MSEKHSAGKGSKYRPVNHKKYDENWEKAFGNKKTKKKPVTKTKKKKGNS
jgi:hypothetical protein